jgi:hypothetical protein
MNPIVKEFFVELEKYEADGTGSMDWAEWAHYLIDEEIVEKFNIQDWNFIKEIYKSKSGNMKSLIIGHIHLTEMNLAEIQLHILTEIVKTEQIDVAYESLMKITFGFVTSGVNYETNEYYNKKELKGVFLSEKKESLIKKFFSLDFKNKVLNIAKECGEVQRNEILAFLKILNTTNPFVGSV